MEDETTASTMNFSFTLPELTPQDLVNKETGLMIPELYIEFYIQEIRRGGDIKSTATKLGLPYQTFVSRIKACQRAAAIRRGEITQEESINKSYLKKKKKNNGQ